MSSAVASRGEIWIIDLDAGRGSEQRGSRPALVVQNDVGNRYAATTIVAMITSTTKLYPVTVGLRKGEGGLDRRSMVNLAQVLTIDKSRLTTRIGSLSPKTMKRVDQAIRISLDVQP